MFRLERYKKMPCLHRWGISDKIISKIKNKKLNKIIKLKYGFSYINMNVNLKNIKSLEVFVCLRVQDRGILGIMSEDCCNPTVLSTSPFLIN